MKTLQQKKIKVYTLNKIKSPTAKAIGLFIYYLVDLQNDVQISYCS